MAAWLRSRDVRYGLVVIGLVVLFLLPALVQPSRLVYPSWTNYSDLTLIHWPKVTLVRESLAAGEGWPWWAPNQLSGQPLAANQLAMLFYPPALILLAGPLPLAFTLFYTVHLAWAGLGTYWLARSLDRRPEAALLAAACVALGGKLAAHAADGHVSLVAAVTWTPWALACLHRALTRRSLGYALGAGVALAAQAATHTYALVYTAYGLSVYVAVFVLLASNNWPDRLRTAVDHLPRLIAIPVVAALLGAAQLLPLWEMAPYSNRSLSLTEATLFSLSPLQTLTGLLFPTGNVGHEWIIYPGLLPVGLAAAALAQGRASLRRAWPAVALAALVLAGVVLALGSSTPAYGLAYRLLPGLRWMRTPARLWFFVTLSLAILAAYGLETWATLWRRPRQQRIARLMVVAAMAAGAILSLGAVVAWRQFGRGAWGLGVFGLVSGGLLLWAGRRRQPASAFAWLTLLVIVADLVSFDWTIARLVPLSQAAAAGREPAEWLAAQPSQSGPFRVYSPNYSLPQPAATLASLEQIDGVEPVHLATYDRFMEVAGGYGHTEFAVSIPPMPGGVPITGEQEGSVATPDLGLLGALNGRYLASAFALDLPGLALRTRQAETWIYENERALPRALVVHRTAPADPQAEIDEQLTRLQAMDLAREALVDNGPVLDGSEAPSPARVTHQAANRIVVETNLAAPGLLVLSEIWYPGWQARDNGRPVSIVRTDAILRGVYLDAGQHRVEFSYRPWTVYAGVSVSLVTTAGLLAYAAWACLRQRRRQP